MVEGEIPEAVWHYTNAAGVIGIISSSTVWATAPIALNDLSEFQYGRDLIENVWDELSHDYPAEKDAQGSSVGGDSLRLIYREDGYLSDASHLTYVISASTESDDLGQWRGYGAEGYAIGLSTKVPLIRERDAVSPDPDPSEWWPDRGWTRVVYDEEVQRERARQTLRAAIELPPGGRLARVVATQKLIMGLAATFKHPAFASEKEVRYVYPDPYTERARFRSGRFGVTPYVELSGENNRLPITGVVTGPTSQEWHGPAYLGTPKRQVVQRLLSAHGYHNLPIEASAAPFRE